MTELTRNPAPLTTPVDFDPFSDATGAEALPLTELQRALWERLRAGEGAVARNRTLALELHGTVAVESLRNALQELTRRHDALRAAFDRNGEHQRILQGVSVASPVSDLTHLPADSSREEFRRILNVESGEPLNLLDGPPLRARLVSVAAQVQWLVLSVDQLVCDSASLALLVSEVGQLYAADRHGVRREFRTAGSYRDQVREEAASAVLPGHEAWWANQYADAVPALELPKERPRPAALPPRYSTGHLQLDESLCRALKTTAERHGATLSAVMLAALQTLLARLGGQDDFIMGIPIARHAEPASPAVGPWTHPAPLRCRMDLRSSFASHLAIVQETLAQAQAHNQVDLAALNASLCARRGSGRAAIMQATFDPQLIDVRCDFGDITVRSVQIAQPPFSDTGLAIDVAGNERGLFIRCVHDAELYDSDTVVRWLGHYRVLLENIVENGERALEALPLLDPAEARHLLEEWNNTAAAYPRDTLLHDSFETQARRTPERTALAAGTLRLSYAELDARANAIAAALRARGVGRGHLVGLCLERGPDMLAAVLGTSKAGAAYVPLDPAFPDERLRFMMRDADVALLLSTGSLADRFGVPRQRQLLLDADLGPTPATPPAPRNTASTDPAYVIYTSGSTGKPKGVVVPHRAVVNFLHSMAHIPGLHADDVLVAVTTLSFDIAVLELHLPLAVGAKVVIATPQQSGDGQALASLLDEHRATVMQATPTVWRMLLDAGWAPKGAFKALVGGEALPRDLAESLLACGVELWNMYGPTETTVWSSCARIADAAQPITIGRPIANTRMWVVDARLEPCPIGVAGELLIGGDGVTDGYLNRPELNAEKFIPDPLAPTNGARVYRTGDLARFLPDGTVECLGRIDEQVKVHGHRIEPGEIEAALREHPAVRQAAVIAREDAPGDKRLVAYLVAQKTSGLIDQLRQRLRATVPEYMVPAHFVELDALPLTPNGKLDRRALPAPSRKRPALSQPYAPPRTPLEHYITGLWSQCLDIDQIGIDDPFFELGGDSVRAARFVNRLRDRLHTSIYITTVFDAPTVAEYANMLEREYGGAVARAFGHSIEAVRAHGARIDDTAVRKMRHCVPSRPLKASGGDDERNPPALFILAPPRSGTTLLRVMLAGHPKLFAAPELQLLGFETLKERRLAYRGKHALWLEGGIRALMEVHGCDASRAKQIMAELEARGLSTRGLYRYLQDAIGERMLVDKTPAYALDPHALARAERDFEAPLYIHLVRHPYAMVTSFENYHMEQVLYLRAHDFNARQLGELVWLVSHQNVLDFLKGVPERRQYAMRYEDLVKRPRALMQDMCARFGIDFDEGLVRPYENLEHKMTDGLQPDSTPMGDTHLFRYRSISPRAAERWARVAEDDFLSEATWEIAERLGYSRPQNAVRAAGLAVGA